ncbi:MAG TPA: acetylglutamate kinase [Candidatus Binataceae bacterium]|nr:acetylglutamate kinase [Candidatus Binataceae bacterium]
MRDLIARAEVLVEALPFIQRFRGKTFVIKYGGHAMSSPELIESFARDVVLLASVGVKPVVVHGGGPQISGMIAKMGLESRFVRGMRVTDEATMELVEMVLQRLNKEIVATIARQGGRAIGLSGKDGELMLARKMLVKLRGENGKSSPVDVGLVGEVMAVNHDVIHALDGSSFIPVVAPIGFDREGKTYNINADVAAGKIAGALKAEKLILMTDVEGIKGKGGQLMATIDAAQAKKLIASGVIGEGMIPKVECCIEALREGVSKTHIIDGRARHAVLLEIFTSSGIGTEVVRDEPRPSTRKKSSGREPTQSPS